jgi:hypothetical protein
MNERIKELMGKTLDDKFSHTWDTMTHEGLLMFSEKFAELIVKECIGCCEQVISDPVPESVDTWLNGGSQCIDEIKQHFGVEE